MIGDLTKLEVFELAREINTQASEELIPAQIYDGTVQPAAELADAAEDPLDYWVRSGVCAELIRHRKGPNEIIQDYMTHELTEDFFPLDPQGLSIYDRVDLDAFRDQVWEAFRNSKRSVFKSAQGAPVVIISPRSRGFSNRETIFNHYAGWYSLEQLAEELR